MSRQLNRKPPKGLRTGTLSARFFVVLDTDTYVLKQGVLLHLGHRVQIEHAAGHALKGLVDPQPASSCKKGAELLYTLTLFCGVSVRASGWTYFPFGCERDIPGGWVLR